MLLCWKESSTNLNKINWTIIYFVQKFRKLQSFVIITCYRSLTHQDIYSRIFNLTWVLSGLFTHTSCFCSDTLYILYPPIRKCTMAYRQCTMVHCRYTMVHCQYTMAHFQCTMVHYFHYLTVIFHDSYVILIHLRDMFPLYSMHSDVSNNSQYQQNPMIFQAYKELTAYSCYVGKHHVRKWQTNFLIRTIWWLYIIFHIFC